MTVHNLAFQGLFPRELLAAIGLPPHAWSLDGVEYYGAISYLKAGLALADRITTVSPTYAVEIRTPEDGMGIDGLLRKRAAVLTGILNGIDDDVWNPATDPLLPSRFDAKRLSRRAANKAALQAKLGLALEPAAPLFGVVSRLTLAEGHRPAARRAAEADRRRRAAGAPRQRRPRARGGADGGGRAPPGPRRRHLGYDEALAHLVQAGVDALLVPSRFEPCGLTQLCALRYGAIPVVARVGGLADTIIDANDAALAAGVATGIQFAPVTAAAIGLALERALALFRDARAWRRLQARGMAADVGWTQPARRYAALYRELVAGSTT